MQVCYIPNILPSFCYPNLLSTSTHICSPSVINSIQPSRSVRSRDKHSTIADVLPLPIGLGDDVEERSDGPAAFINDLQVRWRLKILALYSPWPTQFPICLVELLQNLLLTQKDIFFQKSSFLSLRKEPDTYCY